MVKLEVIIFVVLSFYLVKLNIYFKNGRWKDVW